MRKRPRKIRKFKLRKNSNKYLELIRNGKVQATFGVPNDVRRVLAEHDIYPDKEQEITFYVRSSTTAWGSFMKLTAANNDSVWLLFDVRVCEDDSRVLQKVLVKAGLPRVPASWLEKY